MKTKLTLALFLVVAMLLPIHQDALAGSETSSKTKADWGEFINPDGDCRFFSAPGELLISVPGTNGPHDLAAEVDRINAPRAVKAVSGDFKVQVKVDGRFSPGPSSTLHGRVGYNGAGLVLMDDEENVITLARAVLHRHGGSPSPYVNFEKRADGKLDRMGDSYEHPLPEKGPVFLRLERSGRRVTGSFSLDGETWKNIGSKLIPKEWPKKLKVGVVAISSSEEEFNPRFSELKLSK